MFKSLIVAAGLVLVPFAASAQDRPANLPANTCLARVDPQAAPSSGVTRSGRLDRSLTHAASSFGSRMEAFGVRAGEVCANPNLSDEEKEVQIARLWADYSPDLSTFQAASGQVHDVDGLVSGSLTAAEASGGMEIARNSAWTSGDPEALVATTLLVDYALSEAADALQEASAALAAVRSRNP